MLIPPSIILLLLFSLLAWTRPELISTAFRYIGYALIGAFIGFIVAFAVGNFATPLATPTGLVYPRWAFLYPLLGPAFITYFFLSFGVLIGLILAYFFPTSIVDKRADSNRAT